MGTFRGSPRATWDKHASLASVKITIKESSPWAPRTQVSPHEDASALCAVITPQPGSRCYSCLRVKRRTSGLARSRLRRPRGARRPPRRTRAGRLRRDSSGGGARPSGEGARGEERAPGKAAGAEAESRREQLIAPLQDLTESAPVPPEPLPR